MAQPNNGGCFVCGTQLNRYIQRSIVGPDAERRREAAERHRVKKGRNLQAFDDESRVCGACSQEIYDTLREENREVEYRFDILVGASRNKCSVCEAVEGITRLPFEARVKVFVEKNIFIPEGTRICEVHLSNQRYLLRPLLEGLVGINRPTRMSAYHATKWFNALRTCAKESVVTRYENEENFDDQDFRILSGLNKNNFLGLFATCNPVQVHGQTRNISKKYLIAFLCKLRQGLSDEFLKPMLNYSSRQSVSLAIQKTRQSLAMNFVPQNLGVGSMTRQQYIARHVTDFANQLYNPEPANRRVICYPDGTYLRIPKSSNYRVLRQSFCLHKGYHLLKPCLVVAPDGYILDVHGPYFSDGRNNDAAMLLQELRNDIDGFRTWLRDGDIFIVDRGYRDALGYLQDIGINPKMPAYLLPGQTQLTTEDANAARLITKTRWIVEARNGHLKNCFKFFRDMIPVQHLPNIRDFVRIACALLNRFHPPLHMQGANVELANRMLDLARQPNVVQARVQADNLNNNRRADWFQMNELHLPGFPRLPLEYLRDLTQGTYQIKLSPSYIQDRLRRENVVNFGIEVMLFEPGLLRARIYSRFQNSTKYQLWISYIEVNYEENVGQQQLPMPQEEPIVGYYCTCKSGARTVGCCAHIASVLWFMGYARHEENVRYPSNRLLHSVQDAGNRDLPQVF